VKVDLRIVFIFSILVFGTTAFAQKKLNARGTYVHAATGTEFPLRIGIYEREGVYAHDKKKRDISSTYQNRTDEGKTTLSVFVYPAGEGVEGRLRRHYFQVLQDIATVADKGMHAVQYYTSYKNGGYKINGYSALIDGDPISKLTLFECGKWFFKIRVTTNLLDSTGIEVLEKEVLNSFDPTQLVRNSPLDEKASVYFAPGGFRDSLMLGSVMGSAFKKIEWALENVDSLERASGFPDLYLGLHVESLKEFVQFEKRKPWNRNPSTTEYLDELNQIIASGFLEEFIMEEFDMVMIVPADLVLDFDGFKYWKISHPIKIELAKKFCLVSYKEK
jgi:hypothetical protein